MSWRREFGADHTINVDEEDTVERVKELTGGDGVDVVLDLTPMAQQPIRDAINAVRWGGTIVLAGLKGHKEIPITTDMLINKALTVKGAFSVDAAAYTDAIKLIESGKFPLEKMQTHKYGLDNVEHAIKLLAGEVAGRGRHPRRGHAGPVSLTGKGTFTCQMPIIDTHAHIFPGDFGPAPAGCDPAAWPSLEDGPDPDTKLLVNGPMRFPAKRVWFDAERRLEASAASGLDAELLSPFPALLNYRVPGPLGRDLCRVTNEYIAGLVAAYPAKFYGLGTIPLQDPDLGTAELAEIAKLGLAGVEIASNINGVSLHDPQLDGFWAEAERLGTAVFIHGMPVPSDRVPGPAVATFGVGAEASLGAASIIAGGVAEKYPNLKISFSHAGGGFPLILTRAQWFWGRTWNEEPPLPESERPEAAPWFAEHGPIELARRFYYDSLVFDRRAIRYLADMLGTDRLLVGSDYPAMTREQPIARTLRSMGLSEAELDDVLWNNCFRFLGIDPPKLSSSMWAPL